MSQEVENSGRYEKKILNELKENFRPFPRNSKDILASLKEILSFSRKILSFFYWKFNLIQTTEF